MATASESCMCVWEKPQFFGSWRHRVHPSTGQSSPTYKGKVCTAHMVTEKVTHLTAQKTQSFPLTVHHLYNCWIQSTSIPTLQGRQLPTHSFLNQGGMMLLFTSCHSAMCPANGGRLQLAASEPHQQNRQLSNVGFFFPVRCSVKGASLEATPHLSSWQWWLETLCQTFCRGFSSNTLPHEGTVVFFQQQQWMKVHGCQLRGQSITKATTTPTLLCPPFCSRLQMQEKRVCLLLDVWLFQVDNQNGLCVDFFLVGLVIYSLAHGHLVPQLSHTTAIEEINKSLALNRHNTRCHWPRTLEWGCSVGPCTLIHRCTKTVFSYSKLIL